MLCAARAAPRNPAINELVGAPSGEAHDSVRLFKRLRERIKLLPHHEAMAWVDRVCVDVDAASVAASVLSCDELRSLARRGAPYRGAFEDSLEPPASDSNSFELGFDRVTLRALLTNFDIGLVLLVLVSVLDVTLGAPTLPLLGEVSYRGLWLLYYGAVLPLDFLDYLVTYVRRGHFDSEMTRLAGLAHHFRAERDD